MRVTISLDEDVAAEFQKVADQSGRSLEEAVNESLRASIRPRQVSRPANAKPFVVRAKALHPRPGIKFDDIEELLDMVEGPTRR
jgi:Arc/MetJ family transcription regulator